MVKKTTEELRASLASKGIEYDTPLIDAVKRQDVALIESLLREGADPNYRTNLDECAIAQACSSRIDVNILKLLLDNGANPNLRTTNEFTPLMLAAMSGNFPAVRLLLEHGADPNLIAPPNWQAWMHAETRGHVEIAEFLKAVTSTQSS